MDAPAASGSSRRSGSRPAHRTSPPPDLHRTRRRTDRMRTLTPIAMRDHPIGPLVPLPTKELTQLVLQRPLVISVCQADLDSLSPPAGLQAQCRSPSSMRSASPACTTTRPPRHRRPRLFLSGQMELHCGQDTFIACGRVPRGPLRHPRQPSRHRRRRGGHAPDPRRLISPQLHPRPRDSVLPARPGLDWQPARCS